MDSLHLKNQPNKVRILLSHAGAWRLSRVSAVFDRHSVSSNMARGALQNAPLSLSSNRSIHVEESSARTGLRSLTQHSPRANRPVETGTSQTSCKGEHSSPGSVQSRLVTQGVGPARGKAGICGGRPHQAIEVYTYYKLQYNTEYSQVSRRVGRCRWSKRPHCPRAINYAAPEDEKRGGKKPPLSVATHVSRSVYTVVLLVSASEVRSMQQNLEGPSTKAG